jgi:hypothetical protein
VSPRLQLQLEQDRYTPGDAVKGTILVLEGGRSRSLEVLLEYCEETADYREVAISIPSGPLHEGDLTTGTSFEFELALPQDALPNYASEHGELYWELDARSDEFGRDTHERSRIGVALHGATPAGAGFAPTPPSQVEQASVPSAPGGRWVWRVFFAGGIAALVAGVLLLVHTARFVADAERATGTVVDLSVETDADGDEIFHPVVRFVTTESEEIEFVSSTGSVPPAHSPGDLVEVLYDPNDPSDAKLSGFFDLWLFPLLPVVLGAAFIAAAWFLRRRMRAVPPD